MLRSLVLHIGDPDAGAAALRAALAGPLGRGVCAAASSGRLDPALARFAQKAVRRGAATGLLSIEPPAGVRPLRLRRLLATHFPDLAPEHPPQQPGPLRIVAYLRPHADRLCALHAAAVASGRCDAPLEAFLDALEAEGGLGSAARLAPWREVFGLAFVLRPMLAAELTGGDVVQDFLALALPGARRPAPRPAAEPGLPGTLSAADTEVLRRLRLSLRDRPAELRARTVQHLAGLLAADPDPQAGPAALSRDLAQRLLGACREDAAALDAAFFPDRPVMLPALEALPGRAEAAAEQPGPDALRLVGIFAGLAADLTASETGPGTGPETGPGTGPETGIPPHGGED